MTGDGADKRPMFPRFVGVTKEGILMTDDNDTQAQLDALRAKAEGMGLKMWTDPMAPKFHIIGTGTFPWSFNGWVHSEGETNEDCLGTAATLLNALDPDAVVVRLEPHVQTNSCGICVFYYDCDEGGLGCVYDWHKYHAGGCIPGPRCPGPAKPGKKWIIVEVPE